MKILYYGAIIPTTLYAKDYKQHLKYADIISSDEIKEFLEQDCFTIPLHPRVKNNFNNNISDDIEIIDIIPLAYSIQIPHDNFGMSLYEDFGESRYQQEIQENIGQPINVVYYFKCVTVYSQDGREINTFKLKHPTIYEKMQVESTKA